MRRFASLLERLVFTPARSGRIALLCDWFATAPDPERGFGLAAITGALDFPAAKPALLRGLAAARTDPTLFALSYDYVGDLAETVALIWPGSPRGTPPGLAEVVRALAETPKAGLPGLVAAWLDALDPSARIALLKLMTGGLRVGVSGRMARLALAEWSGRPVEAIEEVWHALSPPYAPLFAWAEGRGKRPDPGLQPTFRPPMLAVALEEGDLARLLPADFRAEWKWDGIRVQLVSGPGGRKLFSRGGEDISRAFPEIIAAMPAEAVLDGELLVARDGAVAPFAALQQRLNRRTVGPRLLRDFPAHVRLYDILFDGGEDLRPLPFDARRARLEAFWQRARPPRTDLSPLISFRSFEELRRLRDGARAAGIEGLMLKRADSAYLAGRPKGFWFKWKRAAQSIDAVLMYAERGHGRRSSFYSDFTFGLWRAGAEGGGDELVPVGKAYSGFTDEELKFLDRFVREHTTDRFGPVRKVAPRLVLEVAFDAAQPSRRHRSGVALRFPRIARLRTDKPAAEADRLEALLSLIEGGGN